MNESQIPVRYARALFESASGQNSVDEAFSDMKLLFETCEQKDFKYVLTLPSLPQSQKSKVMEKLFQGRMSSPSMAMIHLVLRNKRESYLQGIARRFMDLYREAHGIRKASLVTAQPLDETILNKIRDLITRTDGSEVDLAIGVDQDLIGGFVLTVDGLQYDASVATSLRNVKKQLLQSSVQKK